MELFCDTEAAVEELYKLFFFLKRRSGDNYNQETIEKIQNLCVKVR